MPVELCTFGGRSDGNCGQTLTEWVKPDEMPAVVRVVAASEERTPALLAGGTNECRREGTGTQPAASRQSAPQGSGCRPALLLPAAHRAWAETAGYRVARDDDAPARIAIVAPENDSRIWINPDAPPRSGRIALKAVVSPKVPQVVWYVDGAPFALSDPDKPVWWPLMKGAHRIQVRSPLQATASSTVHIVVE